MLEVLGMELSVRKKPQGTIHYLGQLLPAQPVMSLHPGGSYQLNFWITLDHYGLSRLEKLREGGDLWMFVNATLAGEVRPQSSQSQPGVLQPPKPGSRVSSDMPVQFEFRVPKSDWVELVLPAVGFSDVSLLEIPRLTNSQFLDSIGYLNGAWKQYEFGEYDKVLTECRKTMESLTKKLKEEGIVRDVEGKILPDWDKLFESRSIAETVSGIFQKTLGYMAPGAHAGASRSREEAEFALMVTHAVTNLVTKRVSKITE